MEPAVNKKRRGSSLGIKGFVQQVVAIVDTEEDEQPSFEFNDKQRSSDPKNLFSKQMPSLSKEKMDSPNPKDLLKRTYETNTAPQ